MPNDRQPTFVETGLMTLRTMAMVEANQRSGSKQCFIKKEAKSNKQEAAALSDWQLADLYQLSPSLQRVVAGTGTIVQILIKQIVATLDLRF